MKRLTNEERIRLIQQMTQEYVNELAGLSNEELLLHGATMKKHLQLPDHHQADIGTNILKRIWTHEQS